MLRSFPTHGSSSGWQSPSRFLHRCTPRFVAAMRERPGSVWDAIERSDLDRTALATFQRARAEAGDFALPDDVVFPAGPFPFEMMLTSADRSDVTTVTVEDAEMLAGLRGALAGEHTGDLDGELGAQLQEAGLLVECPRRPVDCRAPGIYRLQHASLLFRSAEASVLVDPVFVDDWMWAGSLPEIDAVLVSHSHGDHFSLASLMQLPRDTRIIVPQVERASMLADDMATLLRHAGFVDVVAAPWHSRVRVADIEVSVYPFFGEQPWVEFPSPASGLRNAGNTYVLEMDGRKTWILIDAGREHGRSMVDVARQVRREHGPIDLVMSNLRVFPWHPGQIDGSGRFLFCFPVHRLEDPHSWPENVSITLGPSGIADVLGETAAENFLPYAHWWHTPGSGSPTVDGFIAETEMVAAIRASGCHHTRLHAWGVGARARWDRGAIAIESFV